MRRIIVRARPYCLMPNVVYARPQRAEAHLRAVAEPWVGLGRRNIKRFGSAGHRHSPARGFGCRCAVAKGLRLRLAFPLDGSGRHAGAKRGYEHCAVRASLTYEHWPGIFEVRASFHRVKRADARVRYFALAVRRASSSVEPLIVATPIGLSAISEPSCNSASGLLCSTKRASSST